LGKPQIKKEQNNVGTLPEETYSRVMFENSHQQC